MVLVFSKPKSRRREDTKMRQNHFQSGQSQFLCIIVCEFKFQRIFCESSIEVSLVFPHSDFAFISDLVIELTGQVIAVLVQYAVPN